MNFSFFKRTPKNKRFNYEPRYYDPIKEEIKYRTENVKRELSRENSNEVESMISQGFARRAKRSQQASSTQLVLIALLLGGFLGYLYYGNVALWIFIAVFGVYIFVRSKKII